MTDDLGEAVGDGEGLEGIRADIETIMSKLDRLIAAEKSVTEGDD